MKNQTLNYNVLAYLKSLISPDVTILDIQLVGRYIKATLSSGVFFSVRNEELEKAY